MFIQMCVEPFISLMLLLLKIFLELFFGKHLQSLWHIIEIAS